MLWVPCEHDATDLLYLVGTRYAQGLLRLCCFPEHVQHSTRRLTCLHSLQVYMRVGRCTVHLPPCTALLSTTARLCSTSATATTCPASTALQAHVRGGYAAWEQTFRFTRSNKGTAGGFAVQFGASKDSQTAADTQALAGGWAGQGGVGRARAACAHGGCRCPSRVLCCTLKGTIPPAGNVSTGAATFCFIQAIERRGTKLT